MGHCWSEVCGTSSETELIDKKANASLRRLPEQEATKNQNDAAVGGNSTPSQNNNSNSHPKPLTPSALQEKPGAGNTKAEEEEDEDERKSPHKARERERLNSLAMQEEMRNILAHSVDVGVTGKGHRGNDKSNTVLDEYKAFLSPNRVHNNNNNQQHDSTKRGLFANFDDNNNNFNRSAKNSRTNHPLDGNSAQSKKKKKRRTTTDSKNASTNDPHFGQSATSHPDSGTDDNSKSLTQNQDGQKIPHVDAVSGKRRKRKITVSISEAPQDDDKNTVHKKSGKTRPSASSRASSGSSSSSSSSNSDSSSSSSSSSEDDGDIQEVPDDKAIIEAVTGKKKKRGSNKNSRSPTPETPSATVSPDHHHHHHHHNRHPEEKKRNISPSRSPAKTTKGESMQADLLKQARDVVIETKTQGRTANPLKSNNNNNNNNFARKNVNDDEDEDIYANEETDEARKIFQIPGEEDENKSKTVEELLRDRHPQNRKHFKHLGDIPEASVTASFIGENGSSVDNNYNGSFFQQQQQQQQPREKEDGAANDLYTGADRDELKERHALGGFGCEREVSPEKRREKVFSSARSANNSSINNNKSETGTNGPMIRSDGNIFLNQQKKLAGSGFEEDDEQEEAEEDKRIFQHAFTPQNKEADDHAKMFPISAAKRREMEEKEKLKRGGGRGGGDGAMQKQYYTSNVAASNGSNDVHYGERIYTRRNVPFLKNNYEEPKNVEQEQISSARRRQYHLSPSSLGEQGQQQQHQTQNKSDASLDVSNFDVSNAAQQHTSPSPMELLRNNMAAADKNLQNEVSAGENQRRSPIKRETNNILSANRRFNNNETRNNDDATPEITLQLQALRDQTIVRAEESHERRYLCGEFLLDCYEDAWTLFYRQTIAEQLIFLKECKVARFAILASWDQFRRDVAALERKEYRALDVALSRQVAAASAAASQARRDRQDQKFAAPRLFRANQMLNESNLSDENSRNNNYNNNNNNNNIFTEPLSSNNRATSTSPQNYSSSPFATSTLDNNNNNNNNFKYSNLIGNAKRDKQLQILENALSQLSLDEETWRSYLVKDEHNDAIMVVDHFVTLGCFPLLKSLDPDSRLPILARHAAAEKMAQRRVNQSQTRLSEIASAYHHHHHNGSKDNHGDDSAAQQQQQQQGGIYSSNYGKLTALVRLCQVEQEEMRISIVAMQSRYFASIVKTFESEFDIVVSHDLRRKNKKRTVELKMLLMSTRIDSQKLLSRVCRGYQLRRRLAEIRECDKQGPQLRFLLRKHEWSRRQLVSDQMDEVIHLMTFSTIMKSMASGNSENKNNTANGKSEKDISKMVSTIRNDLSRVGRHPCEALEFVEKLFREQIEAEERHDFLKMDAKFLIEESEEFMRNDLSIITSNNNTSAVGDRYYFIQDNNAETVNSMHRPAQDLEPSPRPPHYLDSPLKKRDDFNNDKDKRLSPPRRSSTSPTSPATSFPHEYHYLHSPYKVMQFTETSLQHQTESATARGQGRNKRDDENGNNKIGSGRTGDYFDHTLSPIRPSPRGHGNDNSHNRRSQQQQQYDPNRPVFISNEERIRLAFENGVSTSTPRKR